MLDIVERKNNELKEIIMSYENYKGYRNKMLTDEIKKIKNKLAPENYNSLLVLAESYKDYICKILAQSRKVYIKFDSDRITEENIFDDIE